MIRKTKKNLDESMIDDYYGNSEGLLERMNTFYQMWQEYISSIDTDGWDCEGFAGELHYWIRDVGINRADYNMVESYITERGVQSDSEVDFDEYEWAVKWSGDDSTMERLAKGHQDEISKMLEPQMAGNMSMARAGIASGWRLPDEFKQKYGPEGNGEFTADELRKLELYMAHNGYDDDFNYSKDNIYLKRKAESTLDEDFEDLEDNPNVLKFKKDPDDVAEELEPIIEQVFDDGGMTEGFLDVVCWQSTNDPDGSDYTCVITLTDGALETKEDLNIAVEEVLVDRLDEIGYDMSFDYVEDSKQYDAAMDIGLRLWVQ